MKTTIYETTDYKMFRTVAGNRRLNPHHVINLEKSVAERNLLPQNPIIVSKDKYVIDGQHRLAVAKRMKLPVYYIIAEEADLHDIRMLNVNVRTWFMDDYLRSYIQQGKRDYIVLKDFAEANDVSVSIALLLLSIPNENFHPNLMIREFKEGDFKVANLVGAQTLVKQLHDLKPFTEDEAWKDRELIRALQIVYKRVSHRTIVEKLKLHDLKIEREPSVREYLRSLERVVNFKQRGDNKIRLF